MKKIFFSWVPALVISMAAAMNSSADDHVRATAVQTCAVPLILGDEAAQIDCEIVVNAPGIQPSEKLSLQYHIRPGFDVSMPATIPDAPKSSVSFSPQENWNCVSQGAPQPPAHGCYIRGEDLLALGGTAVFRSRVLVTNAQHTRDVQSCFRIVGAGADRSQVCLPIEMGMPEAELMLDKECAPAWTDGSFVNLDCTLNVTGRHVLSKTYIRIANEILIGEIETPAKLLLAESLDAWDCTGGQCTLDSDAFIEVGQVSVLRIKSRIVVPHVQDTLSSCTQVTTRTPRLAADRKCVELGGAELTR